LVTCLPAVADRAAVDLGTVSRRQGAGHESLVGRIDLRQGEVALLRDIALAPDLDDVAWVMP